MKITLLITRLLVVALTFFAMTAEAGAPLWTFTPLTATSVVLPINGNILIQYLVTNRSTRIHTLVMTPIAGITQQVGAGTCANPFTLGYLGSCVLSLQVTAGALMGSVVSGPVVCDHGNALQCYQPSFDAALNISVSSAGTTLSISQTALGLSVNNTGLNAALTGRPRNLVITNNGSIAATDVNYTVTPALPNGTTINPASCGDLIPGASCTLIITPGQNASTATSVVTVTSDNSNSVSSNVNVVTYGSTYESSFVFSVIDTTPSTGSIGGTGAALADQTTGIIWSSNSSGTFDGGISIWGIDEISSTLTPDPNAGTSPPNNATLVTGQTNCNGASNGACDTVNIVAFYSPPTTNPGINVAFYAAGLCVSPIGGFSNWYLPSICEEGFGAAGCGTQGAPAMQNMQSNLVDNPTSSGLTGSYWSATEGSSAPLTLAWFEFFATGGGSTQASVAKSTAIAVRCAHALT